MNSFVTLYFGDAVTVILVISSLYYHMHAFIILLLQKLLAYFYRK